MTATLAARLQTHIRFRNAHHASADELALLCELADALPRPVPEVTLTPRQAQLLPLLLEGQPVKVCARRMDLSVETVRDHCKALHRRYGVRSRHELMALFGCAPKTQEASNV